MKTIRQALLDEILYPIPEGYVENKLIKREFDGKDGRPSGGDEYTKEIDQSVGYKGCLADCLVALFQAPNISESDKSVGSLTDADKKFLLQRANSLYKEIGEPEVQAEPVPTVTILH